MNLNWNDIKEPLTVLGSFAGIFAFYKAIIESKFKRDLTKIDSIKLLINEQALVNLESQIYQARRVPRKQFDPFDRLAHELNTNQESIWFAGPVAKYLKNELDNLIKAYLGLREYIQVDEWLPQDLINEDGSTLEVWDFNKNATAFTRDKGYPKDYAKHLDAAAEQAVEMKKAFNRFQVVTELHLFETPLACYLLKKRFKNFNL